MDSSMAAPSPEGPTRVLGQAEVQSALGMAADARPRSIDGRAGGGGHVLAEPDGVPSGIVGAALSVMGVPLPAWDSRHNRAHARGAIARQIEDWLSACGIGIEPQALELLRCAALLAGNPLRHWAEVVQLLAAKTPEQWAAVARGADMAQRGSEIAELLTQWVPDPSGRFS